MLYSSADSPLPFHRASLLRADTVFILEDPYVSPQLRDAATRLARPVLETPRARSALPGQTLLSNSEFADAWRSRPDSRLYTNSENALRWVRDHLADTPLPGQIDTMKDKVRYREFLAADDPDYRFQEVSLEELSTFAPSFFDGPFVAKPAVGFFSLGVEFVQSHDDWPAVASRLRATAQRFRGLYPDAVLDFDRFVLEQVIDGREYAVDAWFDGEGQVTLANVLEHPFANESDVSDRVYRVSSEVIEETHDAFASHLQAFGRRAKLRNLPVHVEFRIAADGILRPIEANPMRFGGWCAADFASHAWKFCPYTAFLNDDAPAWERICDAGRGWTTGLIVADLPPDLDRSRIARIDYDSLLARFSEPLELRRIDDPQQPVFAFLFVRVRNDELDQLDEVLHADLTEYVHLH